MFDVDWSELLLPSTSIAQIAIRGTGVYLALFLAMRLLPRREIGGVGPSDLLVIVLIADAVQQAMAGGYESLTEGLMLAAVIFFWAGLIDWLDYRFPQLHLAEARPVTVVRDGRLLRRNMKREQVTEDEIMAQLRLHGLDSPRDVVAAYIEGDGHFSILVKGGKAQRQPPPHEQAQRGA